MNGRIFKSQTQISKWKSALKLVTTAKVIGLKIKSECEG